MTAAAAAAAATATAVTTVLAVELEVERRDVTVQAGFELEEGQRLALFGTSGAGKTTILESIAGLVRLSRGTVRVDGRLVAGSANGESPLPPRNRGVALVRQPTTLFPHLTVEQNVAYGIRHSPSHSRVADLLDRLGLTALARARGAALSGGQRQRVALGRALASPFRVLLLDEPLSAVDVAARSGLRELTIEMADDRGAAGVLVTHDLTEAQAFGGQLGIIDGGLLLQVGGAHEVALSPASRRVAELVGYGGFVPVPSDPSRWYAIHPDRVLLGARSEHGLVLTGTILSTRAFGPRYECAVGLSSGEQFTVHVDEAPGVGVECDVTALNPPVVGAEETTAR
ncbi:MAG TPA: ABC transporter ATP-binding protein [Acidimicrobiales bacterium]|nr:ABC transporter ATP-binding protein [Acidimicrobiales bacterium]